jgi:hypothetical protein
MFENEKILILEIHFESKYMKETLLTAWNYVLNATGATFSQLIFLLGPLLVLSVTMHFVSLYGGAAGFQVLGRKPFMILFRWLGVSVHELGHAFFAVLFGHKVTKIQLYAPNDSDHEGFVEHSYNRKSIYQNIGMFFIGLGPILFGALVLYALTLVLLQVNLFSAELVDFTQFETANFKSYGSMLMEMLRNMSHFLLTIFTETQLPWWRVVLFLYLLYAVGSSVTLSPADIKGTLYGLTFFTILLFVFNLATLWLGNFALEATFKTSRFFGWLYVLLIMNIAINFMFMLIFVAISAMKKPKK